MKREKSFTYSVRLPPSYEKVLNKGRKYLSEHPDLVQKQGKLIFVSDVFRYALDILADTLEMDFQNDDQDIEIISPEDKLTLEEKLLKRMERDPIFRSEEFRLAGKLGTKLLQETSHTEVSASNLIALLFVHVQSVMMPPYS